MLTFSVHPIGFVRSPRTEPLDDDWGSVVSRVELDGERFGAEALRGLDEFSHIEVVYVFDRVDEGSLELGVRWPRNNPDWPAVGVFAQRNKCRPNRIGVSTCQLVKIEGTELIVQGLDAIDGTPVLDIKPYMAEFAPRGTVRQPSWSHEIMSGYARSGSESDRRYGAVADPTPDR
jgi:tRNA (adenine37-N6)-methyltransferase